MDLYLVCDFEFVLLIRLFNCLCLGFVRCADPIVVQPMILLIGFFGVDLILLSQCPSVSQELICFGGPEPLHHDLLAVGRFHEAVVAIEIAPVVALALVRTDGVDETMVSISTVQNVHNNFISCRNGYQVN